MKLLFDQNLSVHLAGRLADLFPGSNHVSLVGFDRARDADVWAYARENGHVIVTKDADFADLVVVHGFPPKVVWLRLGNCTTGQIEHALRTNHQTIMSLDADPDLGTVALL